MKPGGGTQRYVYLEHLSTEELIELLQAELVSPGQETQEATAYILEVIERREAKAPSGLFPEIDVDQAWENFQTLYNTLEREEQVLYPITETEQKRGGGVAQKPSCRFWERFKRPALRRVLATATICLLVLCMVIPVHGAEWFLKMVGQWTKEVFRLVPESMEDTPPEQTERPDLPVQFEALQAALDEYGITGKIVPTWLPEGYEFEEVYTEEVQDPVIKRVSAFYRCNDNMISLSYQYRASPRKNIINYEKDTTEIQNFKINGITYYLFENLGQNCSVWYYDKVECSISGDITKEELKAIINSIYGG